MLADTKAAESARVLVSALFLNCREETNNSRGFRRVVTMRYGWVTYRRKSASTGGTQGKRKELTERWVEGAGLPHPSREHRKSPRLAGTERTCLADILPWTVSFPAALERKNIWVSETPPRHGLARASAFFCVQYFAKNGGAFEKTALPQLQESCEPTHFSSNSNDRDKHGDVSVSVSALTPAPELSSFHPFIRPRQNLCRTPLPPNIPRSVLPTSAQRQDRLIPLTPKEVAGHELGPPHEPLLSEGFRQIILTVETYFIHL